MKILEYYNSNQAKLSDEDDPTMVLARAEVDFKAKIGELKVLVHDEYNLDFSGAEVKATSTGKGEKLFAELKRLEVLRQKNLEKISKIEKYAEQKNTFCSPSEASLAERKLIISKSAIWCEGSFLAQRTVKQFKSQIPKMIENCLEKYPEEQDPEKQLILGCILESKKLSKKQEEIEREQEQIDNWNIFKDEMMEYINKICGCEKK